MTCIDMHYLSHLTTLDFWDDLEHALRVTVGAICSKGLMGYGCILLYQVKGNSKDVPYCSSLCRREREAISRKRTHQRMPLRRQLNHLLVNATMVMTVITSRTLLAMTLVISRVLFLKKKLFGCIVRA